jgi:glycosyltransferase involved in cell wall biosynthesis
VADAESALRRADAAIAISPYVTDSYRDCPNSDLVQHQQSHRRSIFETPPTNALPGKLLYAGVMSERKNIPGLVRAFKRVSERNGDAQLYICGKVMDEQVFAETKRYIDQEGLNARVHLLGFVSQEELARHFAEAAVLCLYSRTKKQHR